MLLRRATALVVPTLAAALLIGGCPAIASAEPRPAASPTAEAPAEESVPGQGTTEPAAFEDGTSEAAPRPVVDDGTATVDVVAERWTQAGDLPVKVKGKAGSPTSLRVTLSRGDDVDARGAQVAVLVERMDRKAGTAPVAVSVDTAALSEQFKANWSHRLRLATAPSCAALGHSHQDRGKHKGHAYAYGKGKHCPQTAPVEVPATDDTGDELVFDAQAGTPQEMTEEVAEEPAPQPQRAALRSASATSSAGTAYLLSAGPGGSAGTFAATPLAPSTTWSVGEQSGDFTSSYPVPVPPAPAGQAPAVALSYSSQSVDGRTSASNNQASWVGLGWDYQPGSVHRSYNACADDGHRAVGELCWKNDNAVLTLGGQTVPLYRASNGLWHPASDSGIRVQQLAGAANGVKGGQYWLVTDTTGTRYWFGLGKQPTTNTSTGSAWTVPVYGDDAGEPCHASSFAKSSCAQAWSWNLDRVVDRNGNATTYFYAPETNRYGRLASPSLVTLYTRGGTLTRIDYGQVAGHENQPAPERISFATAYRCSSQSVSCAAPTKSTAASYPDIPVDLVCSSSYCSGQYTPVFFDTKRLVSITTSVRTGGAYRPVDVVSLAQSFPDPKDGTDPTLWLQSLVRTGVKGSVRTALPAVRFGGQLLPNRVDTSAAAGVVALNMYRVRTLQGEMGGVTTVGYGRPHPCVKTALPSPSTNAKDCYPVYWVPEFGKPGFGWFHKYLVTSVTLTDPYAGSPAQATRYTYSGGAAWHHDQDPTAPASKQSYGQWRGYGTTTTTIGTAVRSTTRTLWFRGMDGDPLPGGKTRVARVVDSAGTSLVDSNWFAGRARDSRSLSATGVELSGQRTGYVVKRTVDGAGLADAWAVLPNVAEGRTRVTDPVSRAVSTRRTRARTTYDLTYFQPTTVYGDGDLATTSDDTCAQTSYTRNLTTWLIDTPSAEATRAASCTGTVLQRVEHSYDTHGNETRTRALVDGTRYVTTGATYDSRGRQRSATDGEQNASTLAYTDEYAYGPVTQVTHADALHHATVSTVDPARGVVTATRDLNGHTTTLAYDALGRLTKVWRPTEPVSGPASIAYGYAVRQAGPSTVVTDTLQDSDTTLRSVVFLDPFGRQVESAVPAAGGRSLVSTRYDDRGLVAATTAPLFHTGALPGTLVRPASSVVPSETRTSYDELGRPTAQGLWSKDVLQQRTTSTYYGGAVVTTPPVGAATRTYVDAAGRTTRIEQLHAGAPVTTRYGYDRLGRLLTVIDDAGSQSSYGYDLLGRRVSSRTPDAGTTTATFDDNGNVLSRRDARGAVVDTTYDALNRPTARQSGTTPLAAFTYDQPGFVGLPWTATSFDGDNAFTTAVDAYDARNRVVSRTQTVPASEGPLAGSWTTGFAYDAADHVTDVTFPATADLPTERVSTTYDGLGHAATTGGLDPYVTSTAYDTSGRLVGRVLGGVDRSLTYEPVTGRLASLRASSAGSALQDDVFGYDKAGNVLSVLDGVGASSQCNDYDDLNRLVHSFTGADCTSTSAGTSYRLADTGQVLGTTEGSDPEVGYSYDASRPHAVVRRGADAFSYDEAGQLLSRSDGARTLTLTWGPQHTISTATVRDDQPEVVNTLHRSRLVRGTPGASETYVYDTNGTRLLRRTGSGAVLSVLGVELTLKDGVVTAKRSYANGGATVAERTASGVTYLLGDRHGSAVLSVTPTGVERQHLSPYGAPLQDERTGATRGFLHKPYDADTGLSVLDARSYDGDLARFLSPDPVQTPYAPGTLDAYGYAGDNPTTLDDPSGACFLKICEGLSSVGKVFVDSSAKVGNFAIDTVATSFEGYGDIYVLVTGGTKPVSIPRAHVPVPFTDSFSQKASSIVAAVVEWAAPAAAAIKALRVAKAVTATDGILAGSRAGARTFVGRPTAPAEAKAFPAESAPSAPAGGGFVQSAASSRVLGLNLEASGVARPAETAAHHIVAGGAEAAAPARDVLTRFGIDINAAENGVFLPANSASANESGAAVHSTLHTGSYYESVNEVLLSANTASEVFDSLAYLRDALLGGGL